MGDWRTITITVTTFALLENVCCCAHAATNGMQNAKCKQ